MAQPEHPHEGGPPGQRPHEEEGHPLGGPPGQEDKPPEEETDEDLEATHPIVIPEDEPQVEHHEGDEPDKAPA